jgi:hypothetical protein
MGKQDSINEIEVRVEKITQLFDTLDPFPFRERDLDQCRGVYRRLGA